MLTIGRALTAPPPQPLGNRLCRTLLIAIAFLEVPRILLPALPTDGPGVVLLVALFLVSAWQARRATRVMVTGILAAVAALATSPGGGAAVLTGLRDGLLLATFMPVLLLIRATADASPELAQARARFAGLRPVEAATGFMLGAYGAALVLTTGAHAMLAGLMPGDADERRRVAIAAAALRGGGMAVFWSPFFVAMAVTGHFLPAVQAWQIMPLGFGMAVLGLGFAMLFMPGAWPAVPRALYGLAPLVLPVTGAAALVIAGTLLLPVGTVAAVVLVMVPACFGWVVLRRPAALPKVVASTWEGMGRLADEALIIIAAVVLGAVLVASPVLPAMLRPWVEGLPAFAVLGIVPLAMIALGLLGAHPMVSSTVVLVLFTGMAGAPHDLPLMQAALIGWGMGAVTSPAGIQLVIAATMYRVPFLRLTFGANLLFTIAFSLLAAATLSLLDAALGLRD